MAMTKVSLSQMGPPVFNGGFSTFLAFLLLAWSESYVFSTFFKAGPALKKLVVTYDIVSYNRKVVCPNLFAALPNFLLGKT
jgi:hypothetical protein